MTYVVGVFIGPLSVNSINRTPAPDIERLALNSLALQEIPSGELPLYNHDYDASCPRPAGRSSSLGLRWVR